MGHIHVCDACAAPCDDPESQVVVVNKFGIRSIKRDTTSMDHIHVCDACVVPCDDPESQMVIPIGSEGSGNFSQGDMVA
jgi:hypothetical protein